ncbi:hypothetical protein HYW35_02995 [Candidatus Saccharibacteria bacterium]|nr:hypothetical protein [Candidatus Saccharibacteria bacterium]
MRVLILYHERSEHGGIVTDYVAEFQRYKGKAIELVSLESAEGADMAELYSVTIYPAILAMSENGSLQHLWQGTPLPLMDELSYYTMQTRDNRTIGHSPRIIMPPSSTTAVI